jgi:hypothetical protein
MISVDQAFSNGFSRSGRSSEFHSLRLLEAQGLLGTLQNQVTKAARFQSFRNFVPELDSIRYNGQTRKSLWNATMVH